ncbi:MAG: EVE domain-containing protein [Chloroflexi bacterium]|nr:EVE domain-containing protein [Chloroflexota bacterium]
MPRNFWMVVCNEENYHITKDLDFTVQGLKAEYRRKVQRVESGDRLLYYVTGIRCFTATATLTSTYREEETQVWKNEGRANWLYRIDIKPEVVLEETQYIKAGLLAHRLDYIRRWPPENWFMAFQGNLHLLPKNDFFIIEEEMKKLKFGPGYVPPLEPPPEKSKSRARRNRGGGQGRNAPRGPGNSQNTNRGDANPGNTNPVDSNSEKTTTENVKPANTSREQAQASNQQ